MRIRITDPEKFIKSWEELFRSMEDTLPLHQREKEYGRLLSLCGQGESSNDNMNWLRDRLLREQGITKLKIRQGGV